MNIKSLSDLLHEFLLKEVDFLNKQNIKHPPTIGAMYEGLTKDIFEKSIFEGLGLNVVTNSFIENCDLEFDVLLVEGKGEEIPYTGRFKFKPEQVIAVVQAKKNLFSKDIEESYDNLKDVIDYFEHLESDEYVHRIYRHAFKSICRKDISSIYSNELSPQEEMIFHTLRVEAFLPIRIVWGYNGFASEFSFRKSFVKYLEKNKTVDFEKKINGYGPHNFPSLIICGQYSIIKQNGMPLGHRLIGDQWWPFLTTSSENPTKFLLELLWSRLSYRYGLSSEIFGDDLDIEQVNRFIDCRVKLIDEHSGWELYYNELTKKTLNKPLEQAQWEPAILDLAQFVVIQELCKNEEIDLSNNIDLDKYVQSNGYSSLSGFVENLLETGLVFVETNKLKLLTDLCQCVIAPGGRYVAGENNSGRLTQWLMKEIEKAKENK